MTLKVIIPLAGIGARMRPHTLTTPKSMLKIAGKPGMSYILDEISKLNVSEVIFITGHLKEKVEDFVKKNYKFKSRFIEQKSLDGTAGAIRLAKDFVDEPVLIIFVDTIFDADLSIIKRAKSEIDGIIWAKHVEDYHRFGVCVLNSNGYLTRIVEKPSEPISKLANIGLYYIKNHKLLFEGIDHVFREEIKLKGEFYLTDAFDYMVSKGAKIICPEVKGWYDFGKPETTLESNQALLSKLKVQKVKSENSTIIHPVFIGKDVKIINSIVGPYAAISDGSYIISSIIKNSIVGERVKIENALLENSILGDEVIVKGNSKSLNLGNHSRVNL